MSEAAKRRVSRDELGSYDRPTPKVDRRLVAHACKPVNSLGKYRLNEIGTNKDYSVMELAQEVSCQYSIQDRDMYQSLMKSISKSKRNGDPLVCYKKRVFQWFHTDENNE